ncbi:COP23 domain-containing protein [Crocosphaera sp. UHCC 0190]|uniref:COP23 domain-containing protein n=1 Tax=Crocosphaera sp. UHCC 0190 TaxID=3110246 RepID=UPI002B220D7A|nr:COP23 domain-containing protein [Crocosphaera sp. UHCC 0190]MEA5509558.1 COP23 domain-containing protein [Crocosphaera sp. UHCC 0190]
MMKSNLLRTVATLAATAIASPFLVNSSTQARSASTSFVCDTWQGVPATVAVTPNKDDVPVLLWGSQHFSDSGYDPRTRCQLVSNRFQYFYESGQLNYITTGLMNRMPVVCVTDTYGGSCNGLLFTLKPGSNPSQILQELMAVRFREKGPLNETLGRVYINFQDYLNKAKTSNQKFDPENARLMGDR